MDCPYCKEELKVPPRAYRAIESYGGGYNVTTECCGSLIRLSGQMNFRASPSFSREKEDDWGVPIKT